MLAEYGKLSLKDVLEPSIEMADGYVMDGETANVIERRKDWLKKWKYSTAVMLPHLGEKREAPVAGEIFRQPDLAATLRKLVDAEQQALKQGKNRKQAIMAAYERFYRGDIAKELVRGSAEEGGLITLDDLAKWQVKIEEPVSIDLYFSKDASGLPIAYKNYAARVQEMLRQYVRASRGKLALNIINPRPDTPEEEKATASGLTPQVAQQGGEPFYFGLIVTQADQQKTIPAFTPQREQKQWATARSPPTSRSPRARGSTRSRSTTRGTRPTASTARATTARSSSRARRRCA